MDQLELWPGTCRRVGGTGTGRFAGMGGQPAYQQGARRLVSLAFVKIDRRQGRELRLVYFGLGLNRSLCATQQLEVVEQPT